MKTQILVIDDHSIVRLEYLVLKTLNAIFWGAENIEHARIILLKNSIDLIVLDIGVSDWDGMKVISDLKKLAPRAKVLVCSAHNEKVYALRCMDAGANGYLQKSVDQNEIVNAMQTVLSGRHFISDNMKDYIMESRLNPHFRENEVNPLHSLTERELEVCEFLRKGMRSNDIASVMKLHPSTISTYKIRVFQKLKVDSISMLVDKMRLYDQFID